MADQVRVAKTRRGRKALKEKESKVHENPKSIIYLHGAKCSQTVKEVFKALHSMTRGQSALYSRKHDIRPLDDHTYLESLSFKQDASLFMVGTSNKKRPNCITVARMFSHRLLDMSELEVTAFKPIHKFKGVDKPSGMNKPALVFQGHSWDHDAKMKQLKSLFTDIFRGPIVSRVNLNGTDRALIFSADDTHIFMRQYRVDLKPSGGSTPLVEVCFVGVVNVGVLSSPPLSVSVSVSLSLCLCLCLCLCLPLSVSVSLSLCALTRACGVYLCAFLLPFAADRVRPGSRFQSWKVHATSSHTCASPWPLTLQPPDACFPSSPTPKDNTN